MASSYALPYANANGGSGQQQQHAHHGHSRSYGGGPYLSPGKTFQNGSAINNSHSTVKKASSHNQLYTHAETSRETSPLPSPGVEEYKTPFEHNIYAFENNQRLNAPPPSRFGHARTKSSRPRGESDLGRPADVRSPAYRPSLPSISTASSSWFPLPEALTALLIPLPYLLASAAYSTITHEELSGGTHELPAYARLQHGAGGQSRVLPKQKFSSDSGFIEACTLTSGTLLLVGIIAKIRAGERQLDRRKEPAGLQQQLKALASPSSAQTMALRAFSLGLPFYAAMQVGGLRTGLVLLSCTAAGITDANVPFRRTLRDWKHILSTRTATLAVVFLSITLDMVGWTFRAPFTHTLSGYVALLASALLIPPQLPLKPSTGSTPASKGPTSASWTTSSRLPATSPLLASVPDVNMTLISGLLMSLLTIALSYIWSTSPAINTTALTFSTLAIAAMTGAIIFSQPHTLRSQHRAGLGLGCLTTACCAFMYSPTFWPGTIVNGGLSALSGVGVLYDTNAFDNDTPVHEHHAHSSNTHSHGHGHQERTDKGPSAITRFILGHCEPGSMIHGILSEKDSRRIAYFTLLNFGFMFVQGVYGYLSGSLGLLSDTVHMFFDCLGLIVGLGAAVASKWPESPDKPYGWGKLNTLAGFGNGVFLMLVSVEFVWEAIEGIMEGTELRHVKELFVVSSAGLAVNLVGLFAFGHAHAGHDHGHDHGHGHTHSHSPAGHDHGHSHSHSAASHDHTHAHTPTHSQHASHDHDHSHSHTKSNGHLHTHTSDHDDHKEPAPHTHHAPAPQHNENMRGIYLHIAADAGGSLAVILSTALTLYKPWYLWDPMATILIAALIFAAAVPLVMSSGQKLLLVVPDQLEYGVKGMLQELSEMRGVVGYAGPRFWVDDRGDAGGGGHEHHGHDHGDGGGGQKVMGVIHVFAAQAADVEDVRVRVLEFVGEEGMDLVVQVEREGEVGGCWCGGGGSSTVGGSVGGGSIGGTKTG
ncbi:putative zinc transporter msc2 [Recurvomyces mirabilis]|nr:putative zinc transporter msc2 [Recurvomyces mirabilis]